MDERDTSALACEKMQAGPTILCWQPRRVRAQARDARTRGPVRVMTVVYRAANAGPDA